MVYVKVENSQVAEYPYSIRSLRNDNPNTSFPKTMSNNALANWGVYPVTISDIPSYTARTQNVEQNTSPTLVDGTWTLSWTVSSKTSEETTKFDEGVAEDNRRIRNDLLADSDWTQMNDSPLANDVKTQWATYRQELRDMSDLDAWPNIADDDWPVAP